MYMYLCTHNCLLKTLNIVALQVATIFYRVAEILQCHSIFRIALAEAVRKWDQVWLYSTICVQLFLPDNRVRNTCTGSASLLIFVTLGKQDQNYT
jgi:hypothetical protein